MMYYLYITELCKFNLSKIKKKKKNKKSSIQNYNKKKDKTYEKVQKPRITLTLFFHADGCVRGPGNVGTNRPLLRLLRQLQRHAVVPAIRLLRIVHTLRLRGRDDHRLRLRAQVPQVLRGLLPVQVAAQVPQRHVDGQGRVLDRRRRPHQRAHLPALHRLLRAQAQAALATLKGLSYKHRACRQ